MFVGRYWLKWFAEPVVIEGNVGCYLGAYNVHKRRGGYRAAVLM